MVRGNRNNNRRNGGQPRRTNVSRPSPSPTTTLTRTFRSCSKLQLNNVYDSDNTWQKYWSVNPSSFHGFVGAAATFELYRVKHVKISVMPAWRAGTSPPSNVDVVLSPLVNAASTYVISVVDYTPNESGVTNNSILCYNNSRVTSLSANGFKEVCSFTPRIQQTVADSIIRATNTWCSTIAVDQKWNGAQLCVVNAGGAAIFQDVTRQQQVVMLVEMKVEFKQPAVQPGSTVQLPPLFPPLTERVEPLMYPILETPIEGLQEKLDKQIAHSKELADIIRRSDMSDKQLSEHRHQNNLTLARQLANSQ